MTQNPPNVPETKPAAAEFGTGDLVADRRIKLGKLKSELGIDPYGSRIDGLLTLADARARFDAEADKAQKADAAAPDPRPVVNIAGRVVLHRDIGKLIFITLRDHTGDLQLGVSKKSVNDKEFLQAKLADLGDIVVARGALGLTKTGEITVWAQSTPESDTQRTACPGFRIATKSIAPPPAKWEGLSDPEQRYRKRYVDLWANPEVMQTFLKRSAILQRIREFLHNPPAGMGPGFLEVETPTMQSIAGGAAARPFVTHHNTLDIQLFLRIAPELFLKRLLVGGMPRVFEVSRNFRNEGISVRHNPEFTMIELYQAFGDYNAMMLLMETLINTLATQVAGGEKLPFGDLTVDYSLPFTRVKYHEAFEKVNGFASSDHEKLVAKARELHVKTHGEDGTAKDHDVLLSEVWEHTVEPALDKAKPTFVIDYPAAICPLTKAKADDPAVAERFELYIAGMEVANAYTELNDPDVQEANFRQQLAGQKEDDSMAKMDMDFVEALRVGMPPAGGLGFGVDRLVMLLTNSRSIRDVILFPLMRPEVK
jgi:lysyl-tRNA synthetase, class II